MAIYKNTPPIVTNSLILYADLNNNASYPGSGAILYDLSSNKYTGSLANSPTFTSDTYTKYLSFNGTNQSCFFQAQSSGSNTSNFSFGGWYNHGAVVTPSDHFMLRGNDGFGTGQSLVVGTSNTGNPQTSAVTTSPSTIQSTAIDATTTYQANTWYHVFGIWTNGASLKLYVNGVLKTTTTTTNTTLRTSTAGWVLAVNTTNFYSVNIGLTMVYNRALSDQEVAQNYNALKSRFGLT